MNKINEILNIRKIYEEAREKLKNDFHINKTLTYEDYCNELEANYQKERAEINQVEQMF